MCTRAREREREREGGGGGGGEGEREFKDRNKTRMPENASVRNGKRRILLIHGVAACVTVTELYTFAQARNL